MNKVNLDAALSFDLFAGDFGRGYDKEISNRIIRGRKVHTCHICAGEVFPGHPHRLAIWIFDGKVHRYHCCNTCCIAMCASVECDYDDEDPIDARYALGALRRENAST